MASGGEAAIAGTYAPSSVQLNQQDIGGVTARAGCGGSDGKSAGVQTTPAGDLAAAYSSFVANTPDAFDSSNAAQGMLSNMNLAGMLGLLPQQQPGVGGDSSNMPPQQNESMAQQDAMAPQPLLTKPDPDGGTVPHSNASADGGTEPHTSLPPPNHPPHHPHHPVYMMHMHPHARPGVPQPRWVPPAIDPNHWEYGGAPPGMVPQQHPHPSAGGAPSLPMGQPGSQQPPTSCLPQPQQHSIGPGPHMQHQQSQQVPSAPASAAGGPQAGAPNGTVPATASATAAAGPHVTSQPGGAMGAPPAGSHVPVQQPGVPPPVRSYAPYGPYGEPCPPYPAHARPPGPGHYPHPGMPGPHGGPMLAYHPGYPPMHPHMPHRGPYYPHDGRYPPMGPMHHAYPPPPGYYRGHHPGMPPPPHPAYHYMPPPYGGPHPGMHHGMYHAPPPGPAPGAQPPMEPQPRDGAASAISGGTAVCTGGSDGGTDPATAARQAAKLAGSSGGSESEDVGLEAVITLRPGVPEQEDASGAPAMATAVITEGEDGSGGGMGPGQQNGCVDGTGRPMGPPAAATAGAMPQPSAPTLGPDSEVLSDGGGMPPAVHMHPHPHPHPHKMPGWPYGMMAPPPPHGMPGPMAGVGAYDWAPMPPPPPSVMPGYTPMHPQGSWMYSYDPLASGLPHPAGILGPADLQDDDDASLLDLHTEPRRRPSQSSLGGTPLGLSMHGGRKQPFLPQPQFSGGGGFPMLFSAKGPTSSADRPTQSGSPALSGGAPGSIQRSGSLGQLFSAFGDGGTCYVSRRTQRLKKRRSADAAPVPQLAGGTPDPFALAIVAAERAAAGRDSSTGSGAPLGLPPMFPGSAGGARRSSNGSDRTALLSRGGYPPSSRQRSDPGYLIEGPDPGAGWCPGAMVGPMAGLGQLMVYPPYMQQQQQMNQQQMLQQQQPSSRRTSENGWSNGGRAINLPKRFDDAVLTMEYPKAPQPVYQSQRKPGRPPQQANHVVDGRSFDANRNVVDYPLDDPPYELEEEEHEGHEADHAEGGDDSDEDYEAGAERRGYRGYRSGGGMGSGGGEGVSRKRKLPMTREELPQPEKKRKARDPATISKVVLNCVIILRMVNHDLVYEKEIRNALGNNPDTSKALRLLMNQGKLVRTGQGGRGNPFCYRCTPLGISTLQRIEDAATPGADPSAGPNQEQRAAAVAV